VQGLFARKAAFLRTPKTSEQAKWWQAFRANWAETLLALAGLAAIAGSLTRPTTLSGPLLAGLLVFPTLGFAAAPVNSLAAQRAALPPELAQRRRTEWSRERRAVVGGVAAVGTAGVLATMAAVIALLLAPTQGVFRSPQLVNPGRNPAPVRVPLSPSPGTSVAPTAPSATPSGTPSTAPSPQPSATGTGGGGTATAGPSPS